MNGRNIGSGDVSAADERAMDYIMLFINFGLGYAREVGLAVALLVGRAASSSSEESSAVTPVPAQPSRRKGRSLGEDVYNKLGGYGWCNGEGGRDYSRLVSSLKRLALYSSDPSSLVSRGDCTMRRFLRPLFGLLRSDVYLIGVNCPVIGCCYRRRLSFFFEIDSLGFSS